MPRATPNRKPPPKAAEAENDDQPIVQRTRSAAGLTPPPTRAAASVFAMGAAAKPPPSAPLKAGDVEVRSGVPMPVTTLRDSPYKRLLERMKPGDMVELPSRQAYGLQAAATKLNIKTARRKLSKLNHGIWRV
jgi:hypothetical protein